MKAGLGDEGTKDLDLRTMAIGGLGVESSAVSRGSALAVFLVMVLATKHNFKALEATQTFMAHTIFAPADEDLANALIIAVSLIFPIPFL